MGSFDASEPASEMSLDQVCGLGLVSARTQSHPADLSGDWNQETPEDWNRHVVAAVFTPSDDAAAAAAATADSGSSKSELAEVDCMSQRIVEIMAKYHLSAEQAVEVAYNPDLERNLLVPGDVLTCEHCQSYHGTWMQVLEHEAKCACAEVEDFW